MIIDKLGFYRDGLGQVIQVIAIRKGNSSCNLPVIGLNLNDEEVRSYHFDGNFHYDREQSYCSLIEFIGTELPKKPREFTFQAELAEYKDEEIIGNSEYALSNIIGYATTGLRVLGSLQNHSDISKWEVTMKEIL